MKKVQILLSTYNGEKYVEEQINSLLHQTYPNIDILIRDDGSIDRTKDILKKYMEHTNITVLERKNVGVIPSFFELLALSPQCADYMAFCDQDDYWERDKIARAIELLEKVPSNTPAMYCSQAKLVDEKLNIIGKMPEPIRGVSFNNALVQNIATGCTVVFNHTAKQLLLQKLPNPSNIIMHDWWVYLVVSAFGQVVYDAEPRILYRQHTLNSVGAKTDFIGKWRARTKQFIGRGNRLFITKQVEEFRNIYGDLLSPEKAASVRNFINGRKTLAGRIQYVFSGTTYRHSIIDNMLFRILILLNRI